MSALRLIVSAAADRSLSTVFQTLEAAAARARATVSSQARATADAQGREANRAAAAAAKAYAQIEAQSAKAAAKEVADADKAAQAKVRAELKAFDAKLKASEKAASDFERQLEREVKAEERAAERKVAADQRASEKAKRNRERAASEFGGAAGRNLAGMARAGVGVARDIASGAGVDLSVANYVGKAVALQKGSVDIANQAEMSGQSVDGGAKGLESQARAVARSQNVDAGGVLSMIGSIQAKSSDLTTARAAVEDLAKLAKATNTSLEDMGNAAGAVNMNLEEGPDKAERLLAIMRHITKQTADGSVEMADFAQYIGRLSANAGKFSGTFEQNIGELGALAQMAMKGGASTASEATGSAAAWARDLTKAKTLNQFKKSGIDVFADKDETKLRAPEEVIIDFVKKFGGNQEKLAQHFKNDVSKRAVQNSISLYEGAGGGAAGEAAIRSEFEKYRGTISTENVNKMAGSANETDAAKVQAFNNKLEQIAADTLPKLIPAFEKLADVAPQLANGLAKMLTLAAEHPGMTIATAIVASIAEAGLGQMLKSALASTFAAVGPAGMVFAVAAATFMIGKGLIDSDLNKQSKAENAQLDASANAVNVNSAVGAKVRGGTAGAEDKAAIDEQVAAIQDRIKRASGGGEQSSIWDKMFGGSAANAVNAAADSDKGNIGELKAILASLLATQQAAATRTMNVHVDNMPGGPGPTVDPAGRKGPGGK